MKIYAPAYYKQFVCIADECKHSCCIGWEIDVDEDTASVYSNLKEGYGKTVAQSIEFGDVPHFKLKENDRCPHLNEKGLCNIILELGEDKLCQICRDHPRFYNYTNYGKEVGLGLSCEEACRIILSSPNYNSIVEIGENEETLYTAEYDPIPNRNKLFDILSSKDISFENKMKKLRDIFPVSLSVNSQEEWLSVIDSLEYLDEDHKALFQCYKNNSCSKKEYENYSERLFAYLVYRHCTQAIDDEEFSSAFGFCLFFEKLFTSIVNSQNTKNPNDIFEIARILSEELEYSEYNTKTIMLQFI